jgi:hypothetical protein
MHYQLYFVASILLGTTHAQTTSLSLQNNRLTNECAPQLNLCSGADWTYCQVPITAPNRCVATDRLNDVNSISIGLALCCRFYKYALFLSSS